MQEANLGHISIGYDSKLLKITGQQKPNGETCHGVLINIIHIIRTSIYLLNVSSVTVKGTLATKILLLFFEGGSCCMASCYFKNSSMIQRQNMYIHQDTQKVMRLTLGVAIFTSSILPLRKWLDPSAFCINSTNENGNQCIFILHISKEFSSLQHSLRMQMLHNQSHVNDQLLDPVKCKVWTTNQHEHVTIASLKPASDFVDKKRISATLKLMERT